VGVVVERVLCLRVTEPALQEVDLGAVRQFRLPRAAVR